MKIASSGKETASAQAPILTMIYVYALIFHLGIPWLAYLVVKAPQGITLAEDLDSPRWGLLPHGALSFGYQCAWLFALIALGAALLIPQKIASKHRGQNSGQNAVAPRTSVATPYMMRVIILEIVSLSGFVAAFLDHSPGLAVPFAALGFAFTVVFPPTKAKLARYSAAVLGVLAVVFIAGACVTIPETGRSQLVAIPDGYMNQMGEQAYQDLKSKEKISRDSKVNSEIRGIGERIAVASEKKFSWDFTVFDSQEVNAFCLPGGKVGVYTGILPIAKTNAGLAAVLGHEVAHAVARHGAERATQSLIVSGTLLSLEKVIENPKYRQLAMGALGLGVQFGVMLPFSRSHESEADAMGLIYMARAGYDPKEAVKLWERMGAAGNRPPEWLSTHPDPLRRAKDLEKQLAKANEVYEKSQKVPTQALF